MTYKELKLLLLSCACAGCSYLDKWPDNPLEEAVEDIIEEETGVDVDFTGSSKEVSFAIKRF